MSCPFCKEESSIAWEEFYSCYDCLLKMHEPHPRDQWNNLEIVKYLGCNVEIKTSHNGFKYFKVLDKKEKLT